MGKVMNWGGGVMNWLAYIWLITSEAFEETICLTRSNLPRGSFSAGAGKNWEPSIIKRERYSNDKEGLLVPH